MKGFPKADDSNMKGFVTDTANSIKNLQKIVYINCFRKPLHVTIIRFRKPFCVSISSFRNPV